MLEILTGVAVGMIVCAFGMWCFIHGQHNAISLLRNELPEQIKGPVQAVSDSVQGVVEKAKENKDAADAEDQLANLLNYNGGYKEPEKGE